MLLIVIITEPHPRFFTPHHEQLIDSNLYNLHIFGL